MEKQTPQAPKFANAFLIVGMLVASTWFGVMDKAAEMGLSIVAFGLAFAFTNLGRFDRFKAAGFEAELSKAVTEANATLDQLRELGTAATEVTLSNLIADEFMSTSPLAMKFELQGRLVDTLKNLGATTTQLTMAQGHWRRGVSILYFRAIRSSLREMVSPGTTSKAPSPIVEETLSALGGLLDFDTWSTPSSAHLCSLLKAKNLVTPPIEQLLSDFAEFEKTGTVPDVSRIDVE